MRSRLFWGEVARFAGELVFLALVGGALWGLANLGIWLYNGIDDGRCIGGISWGEICVIDSLIMSLLATLGATVGLTFAVLVLGRLKEFLANLFGILTADAAVLAYWEKARHNRQH